MELLAPAGSYNQAIISIESGCDALYGGLKKWSARDRAVNLSNDEYNDIINRCNEKGVKFYLTLNTLMTDDDIQNVEDLFSENVILKPDGIIVGDIGLYSVLSKVFPGIPIHASTQFGAYNVYDVLFFQSLGFFRVILARELTLEEIKKIRKKTNIELEVFVYGNQCVVFSGNCLWGGLTKTGSGNKGMCIGSCNDLFQTPEGEIGNFFWANNIGLYSLIKDLKDTPVHSIKIEGRLRKDDETKQVVSKFRRALEGELLENDYGYKGFLGGTLPPIKQISKVNPQNKALIFNGIPYCENDFILIKSDGSERIVQGHKSISGKYLYTIFVNEINRNGLNIQIRLKFRDINGTYILQAIECIPSSGGRFALPITHISSYEESMTVHDIYSYIKCKIKTNIYECKAHIPSLSIVKVNMESLDNAIKVLNAQFIEHDSKFPSIRNALNSDIIMIDDTKDIKTLYHEGFRNYFYVLKNKEDFYNCIAFEDSMGDCIIHYVLPYLDFCDALQSYMNVLSGRNVVISRLSQLALCEQYNIKSIYGNYTLNIWNSQSANWFKKRGVSTFIAHPELSISQISKIENKSKVKFILIGASKIPYGYTRSCFSELGICSRRCKQQSTLLLDLNKNNTVNMICDNEFGYRTITDDFLYCSSDQSTNRQMIYGMLGICLSKKKEFVLSKSLIHHNLSFIYCD